MKKLLAVLVCFAGLASVAQAQRVTDFDTIKLYTFKNKSGMQVKITNYGAIVTSILVPDRNGKLGDITLGYDRVEDYINAVDKPYFGAIVGRYGNRIAKGEFVIDGETKIKDLIKNLSNKLGAQVTLKDFKILKLGDGIEVAENDFAAEVAATAGIK